MSKICPKRSCSAIAVVLIFLLWVKQYCDCYVGGISHGVNCKRHQNERCYWMYMMRCDKSHPRLSIEKKHQNCWCHSMHIWWDVVSRIQDLHRGQQFGHLLYSWKPYQLAYWVPRGPNGVINLGNICFSGLNICVKWFIHNFTDCAVSKTIALVRIDLWWLCQVLYGEHNQCWWRNHANFLECSIGHVDVCVMPWYPWNFPYQGVLPHDLWSLVMGLILRVHKFLVSWTCHPIQE